MKKLFLVAAAACVLSSPADAATFVRDLTVNLTGYTVDQLNSQINVSVPVTAISALSSGDVITGRVQFTNGQRLTISDKAPFEFFQLLFLGSNGNQFSGSSTVTLLDDQGSRNTGTALGGNSGGGGMVVYGSGNLTDSSFSFSGFDYTLTANSVRNSSGATTSNVPFGSSAFFYASNATVTNAVAAVPEPATWAMMLFGFGGIGFALRRRRAPSVRIRFA
ncbi:PEPxxWA-CTERM sorting domain-containing protein [Sphingomonas sp. RS2018]